MVVSRARGAAVAAAQSRMLVQYMPFNHSQHARRGSVTGTAVHMLVQCMHVCEAHL